MMSRFSPAFLFFLVVSLIAVPMVFAHDGSWNANVISWDSVLLGHDDQDPFKGWATLTVNNSMDDAWGDFHFEIYEPLTHYVIFPATPTPSMLDGSNNPYTGYTYVNGTTTLDFYFYGNPVDPGETVTFKVWTDNTSHTHPWFGLLVYPTPVPEPATIALLGLGALAVMRKRRA
jgi:hypothetical protein